MDFVLHWYNNKTLQDSDADANTDDNDTKNVVYQQYDTNQKQRTV